MRFLLVLFFLSLILIIGSCANAWRVENKHPAIGAFIEVDGQQLHYLDMGPKDAAGPPIVIFHGASANLNDTKLALGDQLAKTHRVILFDRPGRGYSTRPKDGYLLNVQARLMHDALEALDVEKPLIIGQSLGGAVALAYTLQYQEEISGLMTLAAVSHEWPGGVVWYNRASSVPVLGFLLRRTIIPLYGQLVAPDGIDGAFWPQAAPENYFEAASIALLFRPKDFKSNAADVANLKPQIVAMMDRYGEIEIPMHIYVGTHDTTVSPTIHSYTLANQVSGAKLTILPNTGHGLHHTASTEIIAGAEAMIDEIIMASQATPDTEEIPQDTNQETTQPQASPALQ